MEEQKVIKKVKVNKSGAREVYGTGGKIIVNYLFKNSSNEFIHKEASYRFVECGLSFDCIQSIYRMSNISSVEYFVEQEDLEAKQMCDLMCY